MSAFYDLASLVLVPSGYKASKVYAQKPLTTDGQLTFSRASTATRVNSAGLIETVSSNVPRLDYLNSSCPKLLLEPQRQNLALQSSAIDNAAWTKVQITTTANSATSPDGSTNADKIAIDNGVSGGYVYQSIATTSSTVYTSSFFIKAAGVNFTKFYSNVTGSYVTAVINLTTGAITNSSFAVTPTATNYGNGWWRVSYTQTSGGGNVPIYLDAGSTSNGGGITGNGTDGILIWGAQVEAGAYPTSLIPTTTAAVTRLADACSKTGISSLIGQTEGTLFVEFVWGGHITQFQSIEIFGNSSNRIGIYSYDITNTLRWFVIGSGSAAFEQNVSSALVIGQRYKLAIAYKSGSSAAYLNGVQTFSTAATFAFNNALNDFYYRLGSGIDPFFQPISQTLLFKTRLTNAQLAELTTL